MSQQIYLGYDEVSYLHLHKWK